MPSRARTVALFGAVILLAGGVGFAWGADLPVDPAVAKKQIREIRQKTKWDDAAAAKKANETIKQLMRGVEATRLNKEAEKGKARGETAPPGSDADDAPTLTRATAMEKVVAGAAKGRGAGADFAEDLRVNIATEYEEERKPPKDPAVYAEATTLVIDFSRPEAPLLVDLLPNFSGVTTLVLTGGEVGAPVDLTRVLGRAKGLPLESLHIVNFRSSVARIPESVGAFPSLKTLALFNNRLTALPSAVSSLKGLRILLVDANPVKSVLPLVKSLKSLREVGVFGTAVGKEERATLARLYPSAIGGVP